MEATINSMTLHVQIPHIQYDNSFPRYLKDLKMKSLNISNNDFQSNLILEFPKIPDLKKLYISGSNLKQINPGMLKSRTKIITFIFINLFYFFQEVSTIF